MIRVWAVGVSFRVLGAWSLGLQDMILSHMSHNVLVWMPVFITLNLPEYESGHLNQKNHIILNPKPYYWV